MISCAAILLLSVNASAVEFAGGGLSISTDSEFRYFQAAEGLEGFEKEFPNLLDYMELVARQNLLWAKGDWQVGTQWDEVALFSNRYYLDDVLMYEHELVTEGLRSPWPDAYVNLEKIWVKRSTPWGTVQVGDTYASFGRGLALNLVRNTDVDIDTTLRGFRTSVEHGDFELTAVGGLTNQQQVQQDNPNYLLRANRHTLIAGLRADRYGLGPASLGVHGVAYRFSREVDTFLDASGLKWPQPCVSGGDCEPGADTEPLDALVGGATLELFGVGGMDWFVEGDVFHHMSSDLYGGEDPELGYAVYGSAAAYVGAATILVEGKRYVDTERLNTLPALEGYEVVSGPTLEDERVITEDSSAALNSNDITGGRVRVDRAVGDQLTPYVSMALYRDTEEGGLHFNETPETIFHPVAGGEFFGEKVQWIANAGYRHDERDGDYGADRMAHADVAVDFPIGSYHTEFIVDARRFSWGENANQQADFNESSISLGIAPSDTWTLVLYNDYSDNPLIPSEGNLTEALYGAMEVHYHSNAAMTVKAFYGAYKAGIRCAGGQCRNLPGFEGARVSIQSNF
ncbi:MAG: hypothetical protein VX519_09370 [Myxococcota bacterium]|nr:hypothetical protein [Myxococcota bacterium]